MQRSWYSIVLDDIAAIVKDLIPDKNLPTPVWLMRVVVLFLMTAGSVVVAYHLLKDTELGKKNGLSPAIVPPQLTQRGFLRIQKNTFNNMSRLHEDRPEIDAAFMFLGYSEKTEEISYLDATHVMRLTKWLSPVPFSTDTIDELWGLNQSTYQPLLINDRERCIGNKIQEINQKRLKQALHKNDSDRFVMCPIVDPKSKRTFGVLIALWTAPKEAVAIADKDMMTSVKAYTKLIETYILLQPNLTIKG